MTEFFLRAILRVIMYTLSTCSWMPDALGDETTIKTKQNKIIMPIDQLQTEKTLHVIILEVYFCIQRHVMEA